jgi:hypothetical protein
VLVAGGVSGTQPTSVNVATAELFDSSAGTWTATAGMSTDREGHTLTLLASGQALVAGGFSGGWGVCNDDLASAELYDSSAGIWSLTGNMTTARLNHTATLLPNGQVLAAGGNDCQGNILSSAELYTPPDGTNTCVPPPAGLVSWWAGDKTADDVQGINPGRLVGGASFKKGMVGPGFLFDGINDYVQVGDTPSLEMTTAMTLECWIFPTGPGSTAEAIVANREGEYEVSRVAADGTIQWAFANADPGWFWINTGYVAPQDEWTHVALTYDNGLITTYANGVQVHQYQGSGSIGDADPTLDDFKIGNRQAFPDPWKGSIDELKVYNRALSSSEVAAIYAAGSSGNCKPEIFVSSITPSYEVVGHAFLISTSIVIEDENGIGIENASAQIKTILPSGSILVFPVATDATGQATISFATEDSGLYKFKVRKVTHLIREYDPSLNIETTDTLLIP